MKNSIIGERIDSTKIITIQNAKLAIITTQFNHDIVSKLLHNAMQELITVNHLLPKNIIHIEITGALEIGFTLNSLIKNSNINIKKPDAIIVLGCVIRGDTYHFEIVCNESASAINKFNIDFDIPIINGILTVENTQQAIDRLDKGKDFAYAALHMLYVKQQINTLLC
jgi:6,7-dimethyl-8-ribityllumazine synthase